MEYRSNGTGRSAVCGTGRMEQGGLGLHCVVPVEWNREVWVCSVGCRSNSRRNIRIIDRLPFSL